MVKGRDLDLFFQSVLQLKTVKRAGWLSKVKVENAESVADHTFSMCAMTMLLADIEGLDTCKAMKMVVLHDLAESVIGDYIHGSVAAEKKASIEKKAMDEILSGLPSNIRSEYQNIWKEYLDNETDIAYFVHRLDKLEMALQANEYAKQGYVRELLLPFFESAKAAIGNRRDIVNEILGNLRNAKST